MALRHVITEEDEFLQKKAKEVKEIDKRVITVLNDMLETMHEYDGIGIAAPQVGILKRMFIVEVDDRLVELINPEIIETNGTQLGKEGCLSVPGVVGTVERPAYVKMAGLDRKGNRIEVEGTELMAVALCHEYDHLDGILFVDKAIELEEIGENDDPDE